MKLIRQYNVEKNKESVLVTDEGDFAIWCRDYEKSFSHIMPGDEIEDEKLLITLAVRREVKKKVIRRLAAGDITKKDLIRRMTREKIHGENPDAEWLAELIAKLESAGYIDEKGYAERFAQKCVEKHWGRAKIRGAMFDKGFEGDVVSAAIEKLDADFVVIAKELLETMDSIPRETAFKRLYQRGFSSDEISEAYELYRKENE